ncbi:hypothetical protein NDY24_11305 [Xanthomonas hortorum pv. pelargonii]|nr:hypothetical protein NDY24_11305 [Xanthomonas hortorum pv. pelargonii]
MALPVFGKVAVKLPNPRIRLLRCHTLRRVSHKIAVDQPHLERVSQTIDPGGDALRCGLVASQGRLAVG